MEYEPPPPFAQPAERSAPFPAPPAFGPGPDPSGPRPPRRPLSAGATIVSVVALVVAAAVSTGLIVLFRAGGGSGPARRVSLPEAAGMYRLIHPLTGQSVRTMLGRNLAALGPISSAVQHAQIGLYGTGGPATALPTVIFFGFNRSDSAAIDKVLSAGAPRLATSEVLRGTAAGPVRSFDPGPLGGSLQCARAASASTEFTPCAWADASTLALVLRVGDVAVADAADLTRQFRAAAEH